MAQTLEGLEFYLLQAIPEDGDHAAIEEVVRSKVRDTDGVFVHDAKVFIAVQGQVPAASRSAKRLMTQLRTSGLRASVRLVPEPFSESLAEVAYRFIGGQVPIRTRMEKPDAYGRDKRLIR